MLVLTLLGGAALAADCPTAIPLDELSTRLDEAEAAYTALDVEGLTAAVDAFGLQLPCLDTTATPELALRAHRATALLLWGEGDVAEARRSLDAMKRIDPDAALPSSLVPDGHPLHQALADAEPGPTETAPEPVDATLWLDGQATRERPQREPTLAQLVDPEGTPTFSLLLAHDEPLPDYAAITPEPTPMPTPVAAAPAPSPMPAPAPVTRSGPKASTILWGITGAAAVGAGATYGGAWAANRSFYNYEPPPGTAGTDARSTLEARQATAGALTITSVSLAVVAVGSAVSALVVK